MLWNFFNKKNYNYFLKIKHLQILLIISFEILFICLIASWFEIGNGKKMLFSISPKYSYFKPIFNYTRKGLWKGICQNCDTLVCFCLTMILSNCFTSFMGNVSFPQRIRLYPLIMFPYHYSSLWMNYSFKHISLAWYCSISEDNSRKSWT